MLNRYLIIQKMHQFLFNQFIYFTLNLSNKYWKQNLKMELSQCHLNHKFFKFKFNPLLYWGSILQHALDLNTRLKAKKIFLLR